ncbi:MAG TPA: M24 family metallopeptidase [Acidimicrobiales bacterium]|nr:M24 family metallopeptidase [Acidimicrobiales bacterium]
MSSELETSNEIVEGLNAIRDMYTYSETPLERVSQWLLSSSMDELVLTGPDWVRWITGYSSYGGGAAAVVVRPEAAPIVFLSGLEKSTALENPSARDFEFVTYSDLGFGLLADPFASLATAYSSLGLAPRTKVAHVNSEWLLQNHRSTSEPTDVSEEIGAIRIVKNVEEVEEISRRVALCWVAQRAIAQAVDAGSSEIELFSLARSSMERNWGSPIEMTADVIGGSACAGIGAPVNVPGPRVVEVSETLIADIAIVASGYCADITWTHVRGSNPELEDLRDRLVDVRATIVSGLVPGRPVSDVYRELSDLVRAAAPDHTFTHHGGHGIGLAFYEAPFITPWDDTELKEGMTLAVEPGAYGRGQGVRVENNYVVTSAGGMEIPGRPRDMGRHSRD